MEEATRATLIHTSADQRLPVPVMWVHTAVESMIRYPTLLPSEERIDISHGSMSSGNRPHGSSKASGKTPTPSYTHRHAQDYPQSSGSATPCTTSGEDETEEGNKQNTLPIRPETFQRKPERTTYLFICIGAEELARICNGGAPYTDKDGEWLASLDGPNDSPRVSIPTV